MRLSGYLISKSQNCGSQVCIQVTGCTRRERSHVHRLSGGVVRGSKPALGASRGSYFNARRWGGHTRRDVTLTQALPTTLRQEWPFRPGALPTTLALTDAVHQHHQGPRRAARRTHTYASTIFAWYSRELQRLAADTAAASVDSTLVRRCIYLCTCLRMHHRRAAAPGSATSRHLEINAVISSARGNSSVDAFYRVSLELTAALKVYRLVVACPACGTKAWFRNRGHRHRPVLATLCNFAMLLARRSIDEERRSTSRLRDKRDLLDIYRYRFYPD